MLPAPVCLSQASRERGMLKPCSQGEFSCGLGCCRLLHASSDFSFSWERHAEVPTYKRTIAFGGGGRCWHGVVVQFVPYPSADNAHYFQPLLPGGLGWDKTNLSAIKSCLEHPIYERKGERYIEQSALPRVGGNLALQNDKI